MFFSDGGYSAMQYDNARLRKTAANIAAKLPGIMQGLNADAVAVTGKSGISLAFATLMLIEFPLIVVRKRGENSHGASIEGTTGRDLHRYVVLDDFIASGNTIRTIAEELRMYSLQNGCGDNSPLELVGVVEYNAEAKHAYGLRAELSHIPSFPIL